MRLLARPTLCRRCFSARPFPPVTDGLDRWPHLSSTRGILRALDWAGTLAFASSGAVAAASSGMDLLGAVAVGTITAVGGGTLRDVVVLRARPFWSDGETEYLYLAAGAAALTFFAFPLVGAAAWPDDKEVDAVSLGAFAVIGAMSGARASLPPPLALLCGVPTGTGGGVIRDLLTGRPARVLHSHKELYATAAAGGAATYLALLAGGAPLAVRAGAGVAAAAALRYAAWKGGLRLPTWERRAGAEEGLRAL